MQTASNTRPRTTPNGDLVVPVYTHQLPYGVRQHICNLFDADQSWRLLGGQFMHLDDTQLRLVGQALLRNESPTGELLNKLDSANMRIAELYDYLAHMGHCRALELLKPYVIFKSSFVYNQQVDNYQVASNQVAAQTGTLVTPTPSFSSIQPMAIMNSGELDLIAPADYQNQDPNEWSFVNQIEQSTDEQASNKQQQRQQSIQSPKKCHRNGADSNLIELNNGRKPLPDKQLVQDPADEVVRLACANNRKRTSISDQEVVNQLRLIMQIRYSELKLASDNFADSNILGNGGFASVYRGHWKGTDVAIKRLRCNLIDQALNELTILNSYRIDNILPIYGISIDGPEACLVYQFMANGSLEDRLSCKNGTAPLSWTQRAFIAEGVAKGLYYLHTLRDKPLVHGDAKSANVLLDLQFVPKLGDFGLARQVFKGKNPQTEHCTHCTVTSINGTSVYLPAEYLRHKILSPAVDVYSYGIVLLEMATGKRAYDGKRLLIDFVEDELKQAKCQQLQQENQMYYSNIKDHRIVESSLSELKICFELLLRLGVNCAHRIKKKRPDMGQVLNHFAQFKLSAATSNSNTIDGSLVSAPICSSDLSSLTGASGSTQAAIGSRATTRTLTPDLTSTTVGSTNNQLHNNNYAAAQAQPDAFLMSFEENPQQQQQQQQQINGDIMMCNQNQNLFNQNDENLKGQQQIEAMIPLLTELGFSAQDENE